MPETVKIAANATKARLIGSSREVKLIVSDVLSYVVAGHEHTTRFKAGHWDGRSSFLEFSAGLFPAGFVSSVEWALRSRGYRVLVQRKRPPAPLGPPIREAYDAVNPFGFDPRYSYQLEAVRRMEKYGQMIAQVATGGGKSMIARTAVKRIMRPTLFITTRQVLMYQMKRGFEEAGFRVGVMGDGEWAPVKGVNVAMVQTIAARLANETTRERTEKILSLFELAILEEAHESGGEGYFQVMGALKNAHYRLALTATPFMRDDAEANMRLMAVSGQIGIRVSEKLLIDRGILARPIFRYVDPPRPDKLRRWSGWQKAYDIGIVKNEGRNAVIVEECARAARYNLPGMVLVQRKAHGDALRKAMTAAGLRVEFIHGVHDQERRQRSLDKLKAAEIDVLIGSTILDVGVDVPAVGLIVLAGGGKAEVALRQRIGRGLRAKKDGPNICMVLDFEDGGNKYLKDHAKQRRGIVESTPGFSENILPDGTDFPYRDNGFELVE